jgi:uncharacterized membrane protein YozB (DUF420 family)
LNGAAAALLVVGRLLIRGGREVAHRRVMLGAFAASTLFLASYLLHKFWKDFENTPFWGEGLAQVAYLALLATHVILAMTVPPFAIVLIVLGLRGRREAHRRVARIAWPIWMYVSITGVVIYLLLYPLHPGGRA